ncbi:hypothetical protein [Myroides odoratus]|uniref:hypothetical protein n=1 Tax=Myroides odoratus TaxID=256 RepID=UPI00333E847A
MGDNVEFIKHITENNEFIENIINELKGTYGNVSFDTVNNTFFYFDEQGNKHDIDWSALNTVNVSFTLVNDRLVITDSAGNTVSLAVEEIANNETFITNLVENQSFITKLGDNVEFIKHITENNEFIENIINELKGTYGNVSFDTVNNTFFYYDENKQPVVISWDALGNTKIKSFVATDEFLTITDTENNVFAVKMDDLGKIIANNDVFVTELVDNQEFITKLGNKVEFIEQITNNSEFIENIINELKGTYGNVSFDTVNNTFFYYDENKQPVVISWDALGNTKIKSFVATDEFLTITDTENNVFAVKMDDLGKIIANNDVFVTELVDNQEFITKLGNKVEFIEQITNNSEFITNIIEELKGTYGNVGYDTVNNTFFYYDENKQPVVISWDALGNTKIKSFVATDEFLTITDTENNVFAVKMDDLGKIIANNDVFVTELVDNQEFITKLGNKVEFIEQITNNSEFITNIIEELKGTYGNVGYDTVNNTFFYYDENKQPVVISWDALGNTKIKSFVATDEFLTITDTENNVFAVKMDDLGKIIANNDVFVTELVDNQEFITKLGNKVEFIEQITNNSEFITNIIEELKGTYGNVGYDTVNNTFFYYDENKQPVVISWDALGNTKIKSFVATDEFLTITDTENNVFAVKMDDLGKIIANNDVFVTELVDNQEFITKLGNKVEFIEQITNNSEFITNIIEELKGTYGNVGYDTVNNTFFYYDENKQPVVISWDALGNTKIKSLVATDEFLTITDTENNVFAVKMDDLGKIIANNDVFVTELVDNQEFITKLGNKVEFIEQITNNSEFITNIIEELKGTYGNVGYDTVNNTFFYYDENKQPVVISWDALGNTKIKSFVATDEFLTITDTENNVFAVKMDDLGKIIANNDVFVTELVDNQEFITKLGNKVEFIEQITNNSEFITNIIEELKGTYGNVGYDTVNNTFFYYDENKQPVVISWDALGNTKIATFEIDEVKDVLIITDTDGGNFAVAISDLGKIIANNDVFVTNLVDNQEFITKLGDNQEFKTIIKGNSATSAVTLTDGTVNAEAVKAGFTFNNGKDLTTVEFAETLTAMEKGADAAGLIEYYFVDETGNHDDVIIQVTQDIITDFEKIINDNTVKTLLQQFISSATGDVSVVRDTAGDIIIKTATDSFNISDEIRAQETNTTLTSSGAGVYVYKNEEAIKTNGAGITINVVADVQNNFQEIIDHTNVQTILNDFITQNVSNIEVITKPNGDTVFVIYEGGVKKEVNITELIKDNSYVASLEITDKTVNAQGVQAGFSFNDGKNAVSEVFAETLTSLSKGVDAANKIEYSYVDETGVAANTKITVTQDIITDFDKILNDNTVKTLLQQFISSATGDVSVVRDAAGDIIIKTATDSFNLTEEIKSKETKTTLTSMKYPVYVYLDEVNGELLEVHEERERPGETYVRTYDATKYVYNNEANEDVEIKGTDLFGATGGNSLETVTSLTLEENYAGLGKALVYENEEKSKSPIYLKDIFDNSETLTTLEMKLDNRELIYTDEVKNKTILSFNDMVQEPWYTGSDVQATKNDQDIYTMGWVGIGYKTKSTAPNERLRVNGSITATNSYYADYVFENYFDGYSSLKYDYTFNDLTTVDSYIKTNRHLPGITPISELEKTATGYSFNVSELSIQLLEKTEELFLHVIEQKKELDQKADEIQELKNEVRDLTERLEAIEALLK